ncbi:MAG TPA: GNAT family N-acetyltransferase [Flavipsychrobacter sp.]|nr:GNAT family N-acetyltransferase [Flavipsychrobacter sp.]
MNEGYIIKQLTLEDLESYKTMRLEALQLEADKFGNSFAVEAAYPESEWIHRLTQPDRACFGLFYKNELVGITAVLTNAEDLTNGYMTQSYIRPPHRAKGLSQLFYNVRIAWAKQQGLKTLTISHRKSNLVSKAAILKNGFLFTHSEPRVWGDGSEGENLFYSLGL